MSSYKEYLKSAIISFISSFAVAVLPFMGNLEMKKAAIVATVFAGVRAGVKAILEMLSVIRPTTSA